VNIGEANDTIMLLRWLTSDRADDRQTQAAKAAAARLADRSRARIMAGLSGEVVLEKWPATRWDPVFEQCCCLTRACPVHGRARA
jgi:hypothetical protein